MSEVGKSGFPNEIGLMMLILLSTSCGVISEVKKCGSESRGVAATGQVALADGISTANAKASVGEVRDPGRPETQVATVYVVAQSYKAGSFDPSDFLRGHVTGVELRDAQTPSRLVGSYTPPTVLLLPPNLFAFLGPYTWLMPLEDGLAMVLSGQLVLELQTDLPSQPLVRIPLTVMEPGNSLTWSRASGNACVSA